MKHKGILIILLPLLISCESTVATVEEYSLLANSVTPIDTCSLFQLLYADDERLLASTVRSSYDLVSIPIRESELKVEESELFLNYGRSISEVMRNNTCSGVCNDTIHVLASNLFGIDKIIKIPFEGINDISSWEIESTPYYQGIDVNGVTGFDFLDSDSYVFAGGLMDSEKVICILNNKEHTSKQYDYIPDDGFDSNPRIKKLVYFSNSVVHVNGSAILYVCGSGHLALIIDSNDGTIRYLYDEFPKYSASNDGLTFVRDSKSSLGIKASASDKAIYLSPRMAKMVNGKFVPDNFKGYPPTYMDRIEVFSWEGERLHSLCLDYPFSSFLVDKSGKKLYTTTEDLDTGDDIICQYDLPEVVAQ